MSQIDGPLQGTSPLPLFVDRKTLGSHLSGLGGNLVEHVGNERVQDRHRLGGNAGVRVHLLQDLEDVELVRLDALLGFLLVARCLGDLLGSGLLGGAGSHCVGLK